jgi:hypothetical protein
MRAVIVRIVRPRRLARYAVPIRDRRASMRPLVVSKCALPVNGSPAPSAPMRARVVATGLSFKWI